MPPSFTQRLADGVASRVERIARAIRGPEVSRVADIRGVPEPRDPARERVLNTWDVYSSRVSPLAGPTRDRWALWNADDLTPEKIIAAQRVAITGGIPLNWIEMIDQVYSRDGHYASVTSQRVADVIKGDYRLTRAANDDAGTAARNFVEECYRGCARFRDGLGWLLYSNLYGYNAIEIEWGEDWVTFAGPKGETIGPVLCAVPRRFYNVHPKHFRFSLEVGTEDDPLFWIGDGYQPLPVGKFVFLDGDGLHPLKVRHGHAWQCIWYSMFRSISWAGWATRVNRFDMPIPILSYKGDLEQYAEYKDAMLDIDRALGSGKGIRYPNDNMTLDIKDPPSGGRANDPQSALASACDVGQTIRVLGAEMTNATGNTGSFAAKSQDMMVKFALEEFDSARLWERMDEQLSAPLVRFNAVAIADALRAKGYDITPQQLVRRVPKGKQRVPRETDPRTEAEIAGLYINEIGLDVSMEGLFDRIDLPRAKSDTDRAPGKAQPVAKGAALVSAGEAADEAHVNPDMTDDGPGDPEPSGDGEDPEKAAALHAFAAAWDEAKHPRKGGQFAPKGGGDGGASPDSSSGSDAVPVARKASVRKPGPFKLKAPRAPKPKAPKDPNAPVPAPRVYHRDHLGRFRTAPRPGEDAGQLTLPTKLPTVKKAGNVKVDPSKVPGGGQHFKVRVTNDPERGYKGRSFVMNSVKDGLAEFMATPCAAPDIDGYQGEAPAGGWTNGAVLQAVMGKGYGDSTIWKEIASHTEGTGSGKVKDLESAFKALATPRKTGRGVRDWRHFDIAGFQAAHPAFAVLARPTWIEDHHNDQQANEYYREQAERYGADSDKASNKEVDESDLPDYGGHDEYESYNHKGDLSDVPF